MEYYAGPPPAWHVQLRGGAVIELWASGYSIDREMYVFTEYVRASPEEQAELDVTNITPVDPARVFIAVVRIPEQLAENVHTAQGRLVDGRCVCRPLTACEDEKEDP